MSKKRARRSASRGGSARQSQLPDALQSYVMSPRKIRDQILNALKDLPPDATFEDAIERLVFLAKIETGVSELDAGQSVPHDEVKRRLKFKRPPGHR